MHFLAFLALDFCRAMYYSAKRDCAVLLSHVVRMCVCLSVCLSVCPSVTLVDCDHTGSKSWKLITRTISPTPSFS